MGHVIQCDNGTKLNISDICWEDRNENGKIDFTDSAKEVRHKDSYLEGDDLACIRDVIAGLPPTTPDSSSSALTYYSPSMLDMRGAENLSYGTPEAFEDSPEEEDLYTNRIYVLDSTTAPPIFTITTKGKDVIDPTDSTQLDQTHWQAMQATVESVADLFVPGTLHVTVKNVQRDYGTMVVYSPKITIKGTLAETMTFYNNTFSCSLEMATKFEASRFLANELRISLETNVRDAIAMAKATGMPIE